MNTATAVEVLPTKVAEPFAGGFYAGRILVGRDIYALIVSPKAEGDHDDIRWHKNLKSVESARSFFDGHANTLAMAEAGSPLAAWALGLAIGGFTDWYIPSRDELELCYRAFKPTNDENYCYRGDNPSSIPPGYAYSLDAPAQTTALNFREDGAASEADPAPATEAFDASWYWSSTQYAGSVDYAWMQTFSNGFQCYCHKSDDYRARAVRRLKI